MKKQESEIFQQVIKMKFSKKHVKLFNRIGYNIIPDLQRMLEKCFVKIKVSLKGEYMEVRMKDTIIGEKTNSVLHEFVFIDNFSEQENSMKHCRKNYSLVFRMGP